VRLSSVADGVSFMILLDLVTMIGCQTFLYFQILFSL